MSNPKKAAVLLPDATPGDRADEATLAAQYLACQLYAANHDLTIVGRYQTATASATEPSLPYHALNIVETADIDVVLTMAPSPGAETDDELASAVKHLQVMQDVDIVFIGSWTKE